MNGRGCRSNLARSNRASVRSAPLKFERERSARVRSALGRVAPRRFADTQCVPGWIRHRSIVCAAAIGTAQRVRMTGRRKRM